MAQETHEPQVDEIAQQSETVKEQFASEALIAILPGLLIVLVGGVVMYYQSKQDGLWTGLGIVLILIGLGIAGYGFTRLKKVREVEDFKITCPFCQEVNALTRQPQSDFRCTHCNREVPILDGRMLQVFQVRCGYCNALNFYSEKSTGLICEECDREIPIATDEVSPAKKVFAQYTIKDDNQPYDLILTGAPDTEDMVKCLQQMLALNRNQVKDIIADLPQTLLTGIPKKKAELLVAQISVHKGTAESKVSES
jgi:phage FluMu protein Com